MGAGGRAARISRPLAAVAVDAERVSWNAQLVARRTVLSLTPCSSKWQLSGLSLLT